MSILPKKDGTPRRVVDLREVNKETWRQTHPTSSPFQQASQVPPNTYRNSSDAWNEYHSVPFTEDSKDCTTFLTPWGRYRYLVSHKEIWCLEIHTHTDLI